MNEDTNNAGANTGSAFAESPDSALLRQQIAGEQAILARVIKLVRDFPLGHQHWDAQMNYGRTCPLCTQQYAAKSELLRVLTEPAVPNAPDKRSPPR
jgi:hypothetical protein